MKKFIVSVIAGSLFLFFYISKVSADETSEAILKLLVKKGVVTQKEVDELRAEIRRAEEKKTAAAERKQRDFQVYWKEGLRLNTADKKFKLKIGGRIMADVAWMNSKGDMKTRFGKLKDDAELRRARLYTSGTIYEDFIYKLQFDFAGGDADLKDAYIGLQNIPYLGTLKVGHFKEPFSLEELTSSKYITFMERAIPNVFARGRNLGIGLNSHLFDERLTWAVGIFMDADGFGNATSNEYNLTARLTGLPWYEEKGERLLHIGVSYSLVNPEKTLRYRERPETHLASRFLDTGSFAADYANLLGLETAVVYGPLSLQSEFIQAFVDETGGSSEAYFEGLYVQGSYFLTGEHRKYKKSAGTFSRVKPYKNFSIKERTFGAWEIAGRYSYLDLKDNDINGGILQDVTVGLNWYLNPNMRIMGNYVHSHRNGVGNAHIFQMRYQVDF